MIISQMALFLRSKVRWYEQGEKSAKYFLSLEKRNKAKSHVSKKYFWEIQMTMKLKIQRKFQMNLNFFMKIFMIGNLLKLSKNVKAIWRKLVLQNCQKRRETFVTVSCLFRSVGML